MTKRYYILDLLKKNRNALCKTLDNRNTVYKITKFGHRHYINLSEISMEIFYTDSQEHRSTFFTIDDSGIITYDIFLKYDIKNRLERTINRIISINSILN